MSPPILKNIDGHDFTAVNNEFIRDTNLSYAEKGLLLVMLSMNDNWKFSIKGLSTLTNADGERKVGSLLKKLVESGYVERRRITNSEGKIVNWEYLISSQKIKKPYCGFADVGNADVDNADVGNADVGNAGAYKTTNNKIINNKILKNKISINQSYLITPSAEIENEKMGRKEIIQKIRKQIEYDWWIETAQKDLKTKMRLPKVNELIEVMADILCSKKATQKVNGEEKPIEEIKAIFEQLTADHIEYVIECLEGTTKKIKNLKAYIITALYNSVLTLENGTYNRDVCEQ